MSKTVNWKEKGKNRKCEGRKEGVGFVPEIELNSRQSWEWMKCTMKWSKQWLEQVRLLIEWVNVVFEPTSESKWMACNEFGRRKITERLGSIGNNGGNRNPPKNSDRSDAQRLKHCTKYAVFKSDVNCVGVPIEVVEAGKEEKDGEGSWRGNISREKIGTLNKKVATHTQLDAEERRRGRVRKREKERAKMSKVVVGKRNSRQSPLDATRIRREERKSRRSASKVVKQQIAANEHKRQTTRCLKQER